jgi:hypothetical protein
MRWTAAAIAGIFLIALPIRVSFGWWAPSLLLLLQGLGIGICQSLVFPRAFSKRWVWIPANALAFALAGLAMTPLEMLTGPQTGVFYLLPFVGGGLFGLLTAIPLGTIVRGHPAPRLAVDC